MAVQARATLAAGLEGRLIDAGRLLLVRTLGEGGYGVVYLAVEQQGNSVLSSLLAKPKEYAVKVLPKLDSSTLVGECQAREIATHKDMSNHPGVVTLHDVIEDDEFVFLVLDYCPGGDLYSAIIERQVFHEKDALLKSVFLQIVDAVKACHDNGIYHRDVKPDNVFVSADGSKAYLGDFGLAIEQNLSNYHRCGSSFYMSPECLGEEHDYAPFKNEMNDIWSLGVVLANMITGRSPWRLATTNDDHFYRYMCDPDEFIDTFLPMSKAAGGILKRIFTFNPYERISITELREAVAAISTFFPSQIEVDSAVRNTRVLDKQPVREKFARAKSAPASPQLPQGILDFTKIGAYPDDEFLFPSPDPNNFDFTPMSQPSTPFASASSSSTLCDADDFFAECVEKLSIDARTDEANASSGSEGTGSSGPNQPASSTVCRLLERWVI